MSTLIALLLRHWRTALLFVAACAFAWGLQLYGERRWAAGAASVQAKWDAATLDAEREQRRIEQERAHAIEQQEQAARDALAALQRSRHALAAEHKRLRAAASAYARRSVRPDTFTTHLSAPAGAAHATVLADLFAGADEAAGELATALDDARVRGRACEAAWEALRGR